MKIFFEHRIIGPLQIPIFLLFLICTAGCGQNPATYTPVREVTRETTPGDRASVRYDLGRDERRGGHTLARHVARTDEQLQERLRKEKNISAASTWTNQLIAEETVAAALRAERRRLDDWILRGERRPNLALHFDAGRPVGRSLRRGSTESVTCTNAVIVLKAYGPDGFYVLTTYPEARY